MGTDSDRGARFRDPGDDQRACEKSERRAHRQVYFDLAAGSGRTVARHFRSRLSGMQGLSCLPLSWRGGKSGAYRPASGTIRPSALLRQQQFQILALQIADQAVVLIQNCVGEIALGLL